MELQKKLEIIIEDGYVTTVLEYLSECDIKAYTLIQNVAGRGVHGEIDGQDLSGALQNSYIFTVCDQDKAQQVTLLLKPLITSIRGLVIMSDVLKL